MPNDRPGDPPDMAHVADTASTPRVATETAVTTVTPVTHLPSPLHLYQRALLSSRKPARAQAMPPLAFERRDLLLDAADIARYARLCDFSDAQGVPPTWPHLLAFPLHMLLMTDRAFPFAMLGMVHLANRIRQQATLAAGDCLTIDVRCGPLYAHDKGQVFTVLTTARRDNVVVWMGESLYLRTGVRDPLGAPYRAELRTERRAESGANPSTDPALTRSATWHVPGDLGRQYARVSGDYNPIHLWPLTAKLFGFARPIIHGMWSFARTLAAVLPAEVHAQARDLDLLVEFKTPVLLPGDVTLWRTTGGDIFELRDAAGTVPHLRGRWQANRHAPAAPHAPLAHPSSSSDTDLP
ncbi:MaoC/PaaZ C-terminal domain-containing protein [Pandoraea sp. NPDC087047]|uniref:MaoC/PaaZ C-terminal domain-containing protein n=1 Tax=Pandoraea sp. NPDC087047 TaxID=3364390 RepID=UPI00381C652A